MLRLFLLSALCLFTAENSEATEDQRSRVQKPLVKLLSLAKKEQMRKQEFKNSWVNYGEFCGDRVEEVYFPCEPQYEADEVFETFTAEDEKGTEYSLTMVNLSLQELIDFLDEEDSEVNIIYGDDQEEGDFEVTSFQVVSVEEDEMIFDFVAEDKEELLKIKGRLSLSEEHQYLLSTVSELDAEDEHQFFVDSFKLAGS